MGNKKYYLVLPFVSIVVPDKNGNVILGFQPNTPKKPYPGYLDLPGGKIESTEPEIVCAAERELLEETGLVADLSLLGVFHHNSNNWLPGYSSDLNSISFGYLADNVRGTFLPAELDEMLYYKPAEINKDKLTPWAKFFLKMIDIL